MKQRILFAAIFSATLLTAFILLNVGLGSVSIPPNHIVRALFAGGEGVPEETLKILWSIRLPRMFSALILGGALSLSGFILQTYFSNPIAGPFVLGVSSGARLAVAVLLVFIAGTYKGVSSFAMVLAAFIGSLTAMSFVLLISRRVRRASALIIGGVMIGYICSAVTDFIITFGSDANIVNLHNWSRGSFSGMSWDNIKFIAISVSTASAAVFMLSKPIGAFMLGENYARSLGVNVKALRILLVVLSSFLAACVTAFAGPISFIGIAVPHLAKSLVKTAKPLIVTPVCFMLGSVFCLGCDLVARTALAPSDLSISSVTAVFGAPIVIYIMMRRKSKNSG